MDRPTLTRKGFALLTALVIGALCALALAADFQAGMEALERGDYAAALREFRPLAEQGDADEQTGLGLIYANGGRGVPQDDIEAVKWYRRVAEQGIAKAQAALGFMHAYGNGVPKDAVQAYAWVKRCRSRLSACQGSKRGSIVPARLPM